MFLLRVLKFKPFPECHQREYKLLETDDHGLSQDSDGITALLKRMPSNEASSALFRTDGNISAQ